MISFICAVGLAICLMVMLLAPVFAVPAGIVALVLLVIAMGDPPYRDKELERLMGRSTRRDR